MLQISFNFNPETNTVSDVKVTGISSQTPTKKVMRAKTASTSKEIVLNGSSLKLNDEVLELLHAQVGDRLAIRFLNGNVILTKEPKGGNLITKSLTLSCKGKVGEQVAACGDTFSYKLEAEGMLVLTCNNKIQDQSQDVDNVEINVSANSTNNLDESDFTLGLSEGEEIDFVFNV